MNIFIVLLILAAAVLLIAGKNYYNETLCLTLIPYLTISGILIHSVFKIKHTLAGMRVHNLYPNNKLVHWHAGLFFFYCICYIIQNGFIIYGSQFTDPETVEWQIRWVI